MRVGKAVFRMLIDRQGCSEPRPPHFPHPGSSIIIADGISPRLLLRIIANGTVT